MGNFNTTVTPLRENSYIFMPYWLLDNLLAKYEMGIKIYYQIGSGCSRRSCHRQIRLWRDFSLRDPKA